MSDISAKIAEIEEEIRTTDYNKATQHHIGKLKAKLARLKEKREKSAAKGGGGFGFGVKKTGDATVVFLGFPSVGKSTLLNQLTNAESKTAAYDFTTVDVIPGMMKYRGIEIQLLDMPGVISGASVGKGRGKEALSIVRGADVILMIVDPRNVTQLDVIKKEIYDVGIRINEKPPLVNIKPKDRGGITVNSSVRQELDAGTIKAVLGECGIINADVTIHEKLSVERLIDATSKNRKYMPAIVVVNKTDLIKNSGELKNKINGEFVAISALNGENLGVLREKIFKNLGLIRVYMKQPGKEPDMKEPLIMKKNSSIGDVCDRLHKNMRGWFRYAQIWGKSVKYGGQRKGLNHKLMDEDVVTIIKKN